MALYRTGKASMDAQGYVTGYGTKWREQLTLIRPGATMFFLTQPMQAAVITEVISDTQLRAITTGGAVVEESNYLILLHDSLTVDGLAQDVAETLRYYQSKESEIGEALEFFKDFDLEGLKQLVLQVKEAAEASAESAASAEASKNEATNQVVLAEGIKNDTQAIKDSAIVEVGGIRDSAQGFADAAKQQADNAAASVAEAESARDASAASAGEALEYRNQAEEIANSLDADSLLRKDQNLADVKDIGSARDNLLVNRLVQSQSYTFVASPNPSTQFFVAESGLWGVTKTGGVRVPLAFTEGGTGAITRDGARANLQVDRLKQQSNQTQLHNQSGSAWLYAGENGLWGYRGNDSTWKPLGIEQGGTGALSAKDARENLEAFRSSRTDIGTTNLNDMHGVIFDGNYFCSDSANATTALNYPTQSAGVLTVLSSRNGEETSQEYRPTDVIYFYRRVYSGDAWSEWREYIPKEVIAASNQYLSYKNSRVADVLTFTAVTSAENELRVKIDEIGKSIHIVGIIRRSFGSAADTELFRMNQSPAWLEGRQLHVAFSQCLLSKADADGGYVTTYCGGGNINPGGVVRFTNQGNLTGLAWVMVDVNIVAL